MLLLMFHSQNRKSFTALYVAPSKPTGDFVPAEGDVIFQYYIITALCIVLIRKEGNDQVIKHSMGHKP